MIKALVNIVKPQTLLWIPSTDASISRIVKVSKKIHCRVDVREENKLIRLMLAGRGDVMERLSCAWRVGCSRGVARNASSSKLMENTVIESYDAWRWPFVRFGYRA